MFCPECRCGYEEWISKCPCCGIPLIDELPPRPETLEKTMPYEALVRLLRKNGGKMTAELFTTDVGMMRRWSFPYIGYGFAWAKSMQGSLDNILVELRTTETGMRKKWSFLYMGYGFAWAKKMKGTVGGNELELTAMKVDMEKKWGFPYRGYGFGWTQEMSGECGDQIALSFSATNVRKEKIWGFPYQGYGYAWADSALLTLTLKQKK